MTEIFTKKEQPVKQIKEIDQDHKDDWLIVEKPCEEDWEMIPKRQIHVSPLEKCKFWRIGFLRNYSVNMLAWVGER